jgi:hypothetical protein
MRISAKSRWSNLRTPGIRVMVVCLQFDISQGNQGKFGLSVGMTGMSWGWDPREYRMTSMSYPQIGRILSRFRSSTGIA